MRPRVGAGQLTSSGFRGRREAGHQACLGVTMGPPNRRRCRIRPPNRPAWQAGPQRGRIRTGGRVQPPQPHAERQHGPPQGDRAFPADGAVLAAASRGVGRRAQPTGPLDLPGAGPTCRVTDRRPLGGGSDHPPPRAAAQHRERGARDQRGQVPVGLGDLGLQGGQQVRSRSIRVRAIEAWSVGMATWAAATSRSATGPRTCTPEWRQPAEPRPPQGRPAAPGRCTRPTPADQPWCRPGWRHSRSGRERSGRPDPGADS